MAQYYPQFQVFTESLGTFPMGKGGTTVYPKPKLYGHHNGASELSESQVKNPAWLPRRAPLLQKQETKGLVYKENLIKQINLSFQ